MYIRGTIIPDISDLICRKSDSGAYGSTFGFHGIRISRALFYGWKATSMRYRGYIRSILHFDGFCRVSYYSPKIFLDCVLRDWWLVGEMPLLEIMRLLLELLE
jgi:hypothetical protein